MVMPDAVKALLDLAKAPAARLSRRVYNVTSYSLTAAEIRDLVIKAYPNADITFKPDFKRLGIVNSWPSGLDDSAARKDWGWQPKYGIDRSFHEYLIPNIAKRYE